MREEGRGKGSKRSLTWSAVTLSVCPNTEYSLSSLKNVGSICVALVSLGELANSRNMLMRVIRRLGACGRSGGRDL